MGAKDYDEQEYADKQSWLAWQLEEREASLRSENASYAKALTSIRQHVVEKAQEAVRLEGELEVSTLRCGILDS